METIIVMGVISYLLRFLPFLFKSKEKVKPSLLLVSLDYSVCFILGSIIVNVAFKNPLISDFSHLLEAKMVFPFMTIVIAYWVTKQTGSILKSLFYSLLFFIAVTYLVKLMCLQKERKMRQIEIFDTTMRDGQQGIGFLMSKQQKLSIEK